MWNESNEMMQLLKSLPNWMLPEISNYDDKGFKLLHYLPNENCEKIVEYLVKNGCDVNKSNILSQTTPIEQAIRLGNTNAMKVLLKFGAHRSNEFYVNHLGLMHMAAVYHKPEIVEYLLKIGHAVDSLNYFGGSPLALTMMKPVNFYGIGYKKLKRYILVE